jgi:MPBQ/MSBQ methyltransferase
MIYDTLTQDTRECIIEYLTEQYKGVFSPDGVLSHLENHIGFGFAEYATQVIRPRLKKGARVLDIGSGFGSCVLAARDHGLDAIGVEVAPFEVEFARNRLRRVRPDDDPNLVYICGDAQFINFEAESFDAITLWNVIEHIESWHVVLDVVFKFLRPGGIVFILCPNYMAWRNEAHYQVPWKPAPLLPKDKAIRYLESLDLNPKFLSESVFYRTNWEVLSGLRDFNFDLCDLGTLEIRTLSFTRLPQIFLSPGKHLRFYNPFRHSVEVAARKPMR